MYIAMNRFQVKKDKAREFEQIWLNRESKLPDMPGFVEFHMLRGPEYEDHILYSSHTVWETESDFEAWTQSDAFNRSHAQSNAAPAERATLGHPQFEGFEVIQTI